MCCCKADLLLPNRTEVNKLYTLVGSKMKPFSSYLIPECVYSFEIKSAIWRLVQDPFFALTKFVLLVHQVYQWLSSELVLMF